MRGAPRRAGRPATEAPRRAGRRARSRPFAALTVAALALPALTLPAACVYYNALYNAERDFQRGERALRQGRSADAGVAFDSVIAKTGRVLARHPDSKYADDAALLKARSELHRQRWESAAASAEIAARLASDPGARAEAEGIRGLAAFRLGDPDAAIAHLDRALEGDPGARDRTAFLFARGRARLLLGDAERAADDLREAVEEAEASGLDRMELATALAGVGEYGRAAALLRSMLGSERLVDLTPAQRQLVDTLLARAPAELDAGLGILLEEPRGAVQRSVLHLHRGRARERLGDGDAALADYVAAQEGTAVTRAAGEAAYRAARIEVDRARQPAAVVATAPRLQTATRVSTTGVRDSALALLGAVELFAGFVGAWEGRGVAAAEALLRAAEVARDDLGTPALARGLYLRYLEAVPDSPWSVKAILGALALPGHSGDGVLGARDEGEETDAGLRRRLAERSPADPYLLARARSGSVAAESAYVRSERELRERLAGIQGLFREAPAAGADTAPAVGDTAGAAGDTTGRDTTRVAR